MTRIGGLTINEAISQLGISRASLTRYRSEPTWPGDDADWAMIRAYVAVRRRPAGRKPAATASSPSARPSPAPISSADMDPDQQEWLDAMSLDEEMKRVLIEKNKAQTIKYQRACLADYRRRIVRELNTALDHIYTELAAASLTAAQVTNVAAAIDRAKILITGGQPSATQPELDMDGGPTP